MTTEVAEAPALSKGAKCLLDSSYQGSLGENWRGLLFTDGGKARLSHIAGFLQGLTMCDKEELAQKMATELDGHLSHLSRYGGEIEFPMDDGTYGAVAKYPHYKVVLGDDGTFGGFSLGWYRAVSPAAYRRLLDENPLPDSENYRAWKDRLHEKARIRKDLEQWYCYDQYPDRELPYESARRMENGYVQYAYSFNGGLLFHGFGHNPNAVSLDHAVNGSTRFWSTHT